MDTALAGTYRLTGQAGFLLRLANQRHVALFQAMLPLDLTPTQFAALMRLHELGTCSQNLLGRHTGMDGATIKGVIDRLTARGLVRAAPDTGDRRRMTLALAEAGRAMIPELEEIGRNVTDATLAPLSQAERTAFLALLARLT